MKNDSIAWAGSLMGYSPWDSPAGIRQSESSTPDSSGMAKEYNTQYQKMIRRRLDEYAARQ